MSDIDSLSNVPSINFVDYDVDTLLNNMILAYQTAYEAETGESITLYPADKMRIWLYTAALKFYQAQITMDLAAKQNFLKYASGDYLDNIGATRNSSTRDDASYATVTEKFILSQSLSTDKTISTGARVSAGDDVYFATTEDCIITSGQTEATFTLKCTESGKVGNGYAIGTITTLVDPVPFVTSVTNTDISQGGATVEDDDTYTEEIWESPEGYAVAGPKEAYEYRTKAFSSEVEDVVAYSPEDDLSIDYTFTDVSNQAITETPAIDNANGTITTTSTNISSYTLDLSSGEIELNFLNPVSRFKAIFPRGGIVNVVPLLTDATIPTQAFLNGLKTYLSEDKYRPLTDKVQTIAPTIKKYSIDIQYWVDTEDSSNLNTIQTAVETAISTYKTWQGAKLARDINPDELVYLVKKAGAKRLVVNSPVYTALGTTEIAQCETQTVKYVGLE